MADDLDEIDIYAQAKDLPTEELEKLCKDNKPMIPCPVPTCGKGPFKGEHGLRVHLVKIHKKPLESFSDKTDQQPNDDIYQKPITPPPTTLSLPPHLPPPSIPPNNTTVTLPTTDTPHTPTIQPTIITTSNLTPIPVIRPIQTIETLPRYPIVPPPPNRPVSVPTENLLNFNILDQTQTNLSTTINTLHNHLPSLPAFAISQDTPTSTFIPSSTNNVSEHNPSTQGTTAAPVRDQHLPFFPVTPIPQSINPTASKVHLASPAHSTPNNLNNSSNNHPDDTPTSGTVPNTPSATISPLLSEQDLLLTLENQQKTISHLNNVIHTQHSEITHLKQTLGSLQTQLNGKLAEVASLNKNLNTLANRNKGNLESKEQEFQEAILRQTQLEHEVINSQSTIQTYMAYFRTYQAESQLNAQTISDLRSSLNTANKKIIEFSKLTDTCNSQINSYKSQVEDLCSQIEGLTSKNSELNNELDSCKEANRSLSNTLSNTTATYDQTTNNLKTENQSLNQTSTSLCKQIQDLLTKQDQLQRSLDNANTKSNEMEIKYQTMLHKLRAIPTPNLSSIHSDITSPERNTTHNQPTSRTTASNTHMMEVDDDIDYLQSETDPHPRHLVHMVRTQNNAGLQPNAPIQSNYPDPYLMATLLNNYNIKTLSHRELYASGLSAARSLSKWLSSIDVAVSDEGTKVSLAIKKLDVEILERLKRCNPNLHSITWEGLKSCLRSYLTLPDFRSMITDLYSQRFDGEEHPSAYFSSLSALRNTISSVYPDNQREIPNLIELVKHCMISPIQNPYRSILVNDLKIYHDNLDEFLAKFATMYNTIPHQTLIYNYKRHDYANNISTFPDIQTNQLSHYTPYYNIPQTNYTTIPYNQNNPHAHNIQFPQSPFQPPITQPQTFPYNDPNRFQNPRSNPSKNNQNQSHQANYTQSKPWQLWEDWNCPSCNQFNEKKFFNCSNCKIPCPNQPTDCTACPCGRRLYSQAQRCFYCHLPRTTPTTQLNRPQQITPTQQTTPPQQTTQPQQK